MSRVIKSKKALSYADVFKQQWDEVPDARKSAELAQGDVRVTMIIYYASRRPDLDPSLILDLMQGRAYVNDRQVKEQHMYWRLDPDNPRAEIYVEEIPEIAPAKKKPRKVQSGA